MEKQKLVYEIGWLINRIYKESDKLIYHIVDTTRFEDRCIEDVGKYISINTGNKNNKRQLIRIINRRVKEALDNFKKEESISFDELNSRSGRDEDEQEIMFDPEDVLADVEAEVITKETISLLAQGDRRKKEILRYWSIGNRNHAHISRSLARSLGGNEEAHRKAVNRFRKDCLEYYESTSQAI